MATALLLEDEESSLKALADWVGKEGFDVLTAKTIKDARQELENRRPDVALLDLEVPDGNGLDLMPDLEAKGGVDVVFITGHASLNTAVEALRNKAADYLTKPVDLARLRKILKNVQRTYELREEISALRGELRRLGRFGRIVGGSPPMQRVYDLVSKVAPTDATVLITGETGTGKELVAQTVHDLSWRSKRPFITVNCGAIPANLIESELFGHERGSFTGASKSRRGYFEQADGGTLFLDEITEMPAELQVRLLRVLESGEVTRIGGERPIKVDVRVVAATNQDPKKSVAEGKLREDLLYRLMVFPIDLPPLRERDDDVVLVANHMLELKNLESDENKSFSEQALDKLRSHDWPGNVRELRNVVERAYIVAQDEIGPDDIPLDTGSGLEQKPPEGSAVTIEIGTSIPDAERRLILATLDEFDGNKKKAAKVLGISLKTLYNRLNSYERP